MSKIGPSRFVNSGKKKPTMLVNVSTENPISPGPATSTTMASSSSARSTENVNSPQQGIHPFAASTAKLEILPSSANSDMIDVEEEARLYDELCRNYEDSDSVRYIFIDIIQKY